MTVKAQLLSAIAIVFSMSSAHALTYTLTLNQNGAIQTYYSVSGGFATTTNVASLVPQIPAYTLVGGDVINLTINIPSGLTVPSSPSYSALGLYINGTGGSTGSSPTSAFYAETFSLFSGTALLVNPFESTYSGTTGGLTLGGLTQSSRPNGLTFDRAVFQATVQNGSTIAFAAGSTASIQGQGISPVPEPTMLSSMAVGLALLGAGSALRRSKRQRQ